MMDAINDNERVVFMTASQIGKTLILKSVIGYYVDKEPSPILVIQPTLEMAETFSKDRLAPMFRDTPILRGKIKDPRSRDANNTITKKNFPGGHITMIGANSPSSLASRPIRILLADEVSRYPVSAGTEGDPLALAIKRTITYFNRKILLVSTPTDEGRCRIEAEYKDSDQRKFYVPCPECGHKQELKFDNLKWIDKNPETAEYRCEHCEVLISESNKLVMLHNGEWVKTNRAGKYAGFHINALYLTWFSWAEIVKEWYERKDNYDTLKVFWNTVLGLPFANKGDSPEWESIYDRRESYELNTIPEPVRFLTAACDVQKNRIEIEVKGWGKDGQSWSICHDVLPGQAEAFTAIDDYLNRTWTHPSGVQLQIRGLGIDTGGDKTQQVYDWCRKHPNSRVFALKGASSVAASAVGTPKSVDVNYQGRKVSNGVMLWPVGVSMIKSELYYRLKLRPDENRDFPPGYLHFPEYPQDFFKQLTAESLRFVMRNGHKVATWEKPPGIANEALDLSVYNRAVSIILGIDRLTDKEWQDMESQFKNVKTVSSQPIFRRRTGKIRF
jgi:phage terminase large subunit GpA-like protein